MNGCTSSKQSCFNAYSTPGSVLGGYAYAMKTSAIQNGFLDARAASSGKLAAASNSTATQAQLAALPAVFVVLDPAGNPEAIADKYGYRGMLWVGLMTFMWPLVIAAFVGVMACIAMFDK